MGEASINNKNFRIAVDKYPLTEIRSCERIKTFLLSGLYTYDFRFAESQSHPRTLQSECLSVKQAH